MCVTRKARGFGFTVFLSDSEPLRGSEMPRLLLTCEWTSPALTSSRRSRRCMVSPQNADVSESANYPPVKKEKKKHANSEKKILRAHKFKRKTGRFSQVPVQLPNEDSGCTTQTDAATCKEIKVRPGSESGAAPPSSELNRGASQLCSTPAPGPSTVSHPSKMGPTHCGGCFRGR